MKILLSYSSIRLSAIPDVIETTEPISTTSGIWGVTKSKEQSPSSEDPSRSAEEEIPSSPCNYRVHKSSPLDRILIQTNPIHTSTHTSFL
jgi:hypothetical protein